MLPRMPRSNPLVLGAIVVALAFTALGCAGRSILPPPEVRYPAPAPARSISPGTRYVDALVAALAREPQVMHLVKTQKLTVVEGNDSATLDQSMTLDLYGRDMNAHMESTSKGKTTKLDLILVGKSAYMRDGSGPFKKYPRSKYTESYTNIAQALRLVRDESYLKYVGKETIDEQELHHLTAVRDLPYITDTGDHGTFESLDIWVEEDGRPVLAKGKVLLIGSYGREFRGTNEYHFSKFGMSIKIAAPKT